MNIITKQFAVPLFCLQIDEKDMCSSVCVMPKTFYVKCFYYVASLKETATYSSGQLHKENNALLKHSLKNNLYDHKHIRTLFFTDTHYTDFPKVLA